MKIGIVCSATYGGSGVLATELGRFLALRGHEIHFITSAMPFRLTHETPKNVFFHEVQRMDYPVFAGELYGIALASKITQVVSDYKLDIVHAHYAVPHAISAWLAQAVHSKQKFRLVTTLHGTDITLVGQSPSYFPMVKFALQQSDAVTSVSNWLRQLTLDEFGLDNGVEVIPNFVDLEKFRRGLSPCQRSRFATPDEKVLFHISNFRPVKRVGDVVKVFAKVREKMPSKLVMIGDGPERDLAMSLSRELNVHEHVHFLGKIEQIELYFACADLMLFPSEYESFGLAALEAMASEIVVIASNGGGLPEVIDHGVNGFLAPVGDVDSMAKYAIEILSDDDRREKMAVAARQKAAREFDANIIIDQYEELYQSVLEQKVPVAR